MNEANVIQKNKFSFLIQQDGPSTCTFGTPNAGLVKGGSLNRKAEITMNTDFFWSSYTMGVSFGDIDP
jgi:hypothetical protein